VSAVELHRDTFAATRDALLQLLKQEGIAPPRRRDPRRSLAGTG
jgi:hypothetical protein